MIEPDEYTDYLAAYEEESLSHLGSISLLEVFAALEKDLSCPHGYGQLDVCPFCEKEILPGESK